MSVVSISELTERPGDFTGEEGNETRVFRVLVDSKTDTPTTIAASGQLPAFLEAHPNNVFLLCRSLSVAPLTGHWQWWKATAKYSSEPLSQREREKLEPNPLLRAAKIRWESREESEAMFFDEDGYALVNSAGDSYDPVPERTICNWTCYVEKNVAAVPSWFLEYASVVNEDSYKIPRNVILAGTGTGTGTGADELFDVEPGYSRLVNPRVSEVMEENGVQYVTMTFALEMKQLQNVDGSQVLDPIARTPVTFEPWDLIVLDQGLRQKIPASGTGTGTAVSGQIRQILDDDGNMINSPVPLDGDGYKLDDPRPDSVIYFRHRKYRRKPFSVLVPYLT